MDIRKRFRILDDDIEETDTPTNTITESEFKELQERMKQRFNMECETVFEAVYDYIDWEQNFLKTTQIVVD